MDRNRNKSLLTIAIVALFLLPPKGSLSCECMRSDSVMEVMCNHERCNCCQERPTVCCPTCDGVDVLTSDPGIPCDCPADCICQSSTQPAECRIGVSPSAALDAVVATSSARLTPASTDLLRRDVGLLAPRASDTSQMRCARLCRFVI